MMIEEGEWKRCRHGESYHTGRDRNGFWYHKCLLCGDDWYTSCDEYDKVKEFLEREGLA